MLERDSGSIRKLTGKVERLVERFCAAIKDGELQGEEDITSRLLESLAQDLTHSENGFAIRAKAITINKYVEEKRIGADALILLSYASAEINLSKGVLVQAKNLKEGATMRTREMDKLKIQCACMLQSTSESYAWTYSDTAFRAYRGWSILALKSLRPGDLCSMMLPEFFSRFLRCQIGDPDLTFPDIQRLQEIIERQGIRRVLLISAQSWKDGSIEPGPEMPGPMPPDVEGLARDIENRFAKTSVPQQRDFLRGVELNDHLGADDIDLHLKS